MKHIIISALFLALLLPVSPASAQSAVTVESQAKLITLLLAQIKSLQKQIVELKADAKEVKKVRRQEKEEADEVKVKKDTGTKDGVITFRKQATGAQDFSKAVKLVTYEVYAKDEALYGSTFSARHVINLGKSCPQIIEKGEKANCSILLPVGYGKSPATYRIERVEIEGVSGKDYKNTTVVEGSVTNDLGTYIR